jgi:hypothetical protein
MKHHKWTVGLAAVGLITLASAAKAEEKSSAVMTALSTTTLSGYVDTSMQWNLGTGDSHSPAYKYGGPAKADGFNLDAVELTLEKPLDGQGWQAGYKVQFLLGPDAATLGTASPGTVTGGFAIKNAYVNLLAPVGTGIEFKVGVFDSVLGYESTEAINNANFTRSWGHTFEPSELTGILATYRVNDSIAFSAGVADTVSPSINARAAVPPTAESYKAYLGSVALTAPQSWGVFAGSTLCAGIMNGWDTALGEPQQNYYIGGTMTTPVNGLRIGASFDYAKTEAKTSGILGATSFGAHSFAGYASYQATPKLSLHGRVEYADVSPVAANALQNAGIGIASSVFSATGTIQYDLWKNVLSRVEIRWDHALDGTDSFGNTRAAPGFQGGHFTSGSLANSYIIAANIIYRF